MVDILGSKIALLVGLTLNAVYTLIFALASLQAAGGPLQNAQIEDLFYQERSLKRIKVMCISIV